MRQRDRISMGAGAVGFGVCIFWIGGAPHYALAIAAAALAVAHGMLVSSRRRFAAVSPLVVLLAAALGLTIVQLVPLPRSVVTLLNPTGVRLRETSLQLLGHGPDAWQSISLDVPATLRASVLLTVLLAAALLALRFAAAERGRQWLIMAVTLAAGGVAVVTWCHVAVDARAVYGLYQPRDATPTWLGPLLNANHLGSLCAVGAVTALGLFFSDKKRQLRRVAWALIGLGCMTTTLLTQSRGATVALLFGGFITLGVFVAQRLAPTATPRSTHDFWRNKVPMAVFATCLVGLVVYASASRVASQLANTEVGELSDASSKYMAWQSSLRLIEEAPLLGIGRGAFEAVFTRVHPASSLHTFSHVENEYLQGVIDWGIGGGALLAVFALWLIVTMVRRWNRGPLAAAALGGLAVLATQSVVDFGLSLPALAMTATLLAASLAYVALDDGRQRRRSSTGGGAPTATTPLTNPPEAAPTVPHGIVPTDTTAHATPRPEPRAHRASSRTLKPETSRARWQRLGLRGAMVFLLGGATALASTTAVETLSEAHARLPEGRTSVATAFAFIEAHPLDYLGVGRATVALLNQQDPRANEFLRHARRLHPTHAGLHRVTARLLARGERFAQATIEYRLALQHGPSYRAVVAELLTTLPSVALMSEAIPVTLASPAVVATYLHSFNRHDVAVAWLRRVATARPAVREMGKLLAEAGRKANDSAAILDGLRMSLAQTPNAIHALALANELKQQGDLAAAWQTLQLPAATIGDASHTTRAWLRKCELASESVKLPSDARAPASAISIELARDCWRRLVASGRLLANEVDTATRALDALSALPSALAPVPSTTSSTQPAAAVTPTPPPTVAPTTP